MVNSNLLGRVLIELLRKRCVANIILSNVV